MYILFIIILLLIIYLIKSFKNLKSENQFIIKKLTGLEKDYRFDLNLFIEYENIKNKKYNENELKNKYRTNYLLLSFSSKIKNTIAFFRIILFRKIVNCLLINIINKNKKSLKKTESKFKDVLKPKDNQKKFSIIYSIEKINGIEKGICNIIIDFLMFIHDYASSKIHLNEIENSIDIMKFINKKNGEDNEENFSANKTETSLKSEGLINYVFSPFNFENETLNLIKEIENEESNDENNNENNVNNIILNKEKDNKAEKEDEKEEIKEEEVEDEKEEIKEEEDEKEEEIKEEEIKEEEGKEEEKEEEGKEISDNSNNDGNQINNNEEIEETKDTIKTRKGRKTKIFQIKTDKDIIQNEVQKTHENETILKKINDEKLKKEEDVIDEKKDKMFESFKEKYFLNNDIKEDVLKVIKKVYFDTKENKYNTSKLIQLYNDNYNDIDKLKNKQENYKNKITNFEYQIPEEYSIEKIFANYKLQFDENSKIYEGKDVNTHYRFTDSYKKIININAIKTLDLEQLKMATIAITGNYYINLISEDKGRFGNDLEVEDI